MIQQLVLDQRKAQARETFETLQRPAIETIESIERDCAGPHADGASEPGRFEIMPWLRTDHSGEPGEGGAMAMLSGRSLSKLASTHQRCWEHWPRNSPSKFPAPTPIRGFGRRAFR